MTGVSHGQVWQSRKPNNLCAWGEKGKSETTTPEVDERSVHISWGDVNKCRLVPDGLSPQSKAHSFSEVQRGELDELIGVSDRARVRGFLQECGRPS